MPLTTRPLSTSRQGMIRFASIFSQVADLYVKPLCEISQHPQAQHPGSSPDETARHKYSPPQLPTHIAPHTQSHPQQPFIPRLAVKRMHEITERSLRNSFKQRMRSRLMNPVPTNMRHDQLVLKPPHASPQQSQALASIQTLLTLQTTTASRHKHPATAFPRSLFPSPTDQSHVLSAPSYTRQTRQHPATPVAPLSRNTLSSPLTIASQPVAANAFSTERRLPTP